MKLTREEIEAIRKEATATCHHEPCRSRILPLCALALEQMDLLAKAKTTIEHLAEQQSMPDDWYKQPLAEIAAALSEPNTPSLEGKTDA